MSGFHFAVTYCKTGADERMMERSRYSAVRQFLSRASKDLGHLAPACINDDDDVVYWYSFSNHYTKCAFTQP